jgi:hypothetical protein
LTPRWAQPVVPDGGPFQRAVLCGRRGSRSLPARLMHVIDRLTRGAGSATFRGGPLARAGQNRDARRRAAQRPTGRRTTAQERNNEITSIASLHNALTQSPPSPLSRHADDDAWRALDTGHWGSSLVSECLMLQIEEEHRMRVRARSEQSECCTHRVAHNKLMPVHTPRLCTEMNSTRTLLTVNVKLVVS